MQNEGEINFNPGNESPSFQKGIQREQQEPESAIKQIFDITNRAHSLIYNLSDKVALEKVDQAKIMVKQILEF